MSTWYQISTYGKPEITPVEVSKETPEFITFKKQDWNGGLYERRQRKAGEFFPTFEAAKQAYLDKFDRAIRSNRDQYSQLCSYRKQAQELFL